MGSTCIASDVNIDLNRVQLIRKTESFLTNPVLEAIRKMDQVDMDENSNQKALILYPIIEISKEIEQIKTKLKAINGNGNDKTLVNEIQNILGYPKYAPKEFKKIFNR